MIRNGTGDEKRQQRWEKKGQERRDKWLISIHYLPGLISPNSASATAAPPYSPGNQASRMAGT